MIFPTTIDAASAVRTRRAAQPRIARAGPASATLPGAGLAHARPDSQASSPARTRRRTLTSPAPIAPPQSTTHRPAPTSQIIVLQPLCCISLGIHRNVQIARTLRISAVPGIPVSAGKRIFDGSGWRTGNRAGSRSPAKRAGNCNAHRDRAPREMKRGLGMTGRPQFHGADVSVPFPGAASYPRELAWTAAGVPDRHRSDR